MNRYFMLLDAAASTTDTSAEMGVGSMLLMLLPYALIIVALYFIMIRPQSKKRKKEEAMRKGAQIGDEITTIGGITGRIVSIKEENETLVIETGTDRSKIRIKRWAIGSVDTIHDDANNQRDIPSVSFFLRIIKILLEYHFHK